MFDLPDESRIFIPGRLTDFEENLFLKREVSDLKLEIEALIQKLEDTEYRYRNLVPAEIHEKKITKLNNQVSDLSKKIVAERERGKILLAELDRLRTVFDMTGIAPIKRKRNGGKKRQKERSRAIGTIHR